VSGTCTETVLHSFDGGKDGFTPNASLVFDHAGEIFGTTGLRDTPVRRRQRCPVRGLLALLNEDNNAFKEFYILARLNRLTRLHLSLDHPLLKEAKRLAILSEFCEAAKSARHRRASSRF